MHYIMHGGNSKTPPPAKKKKEKETVVYGPHFILTRDAHVDIKIQCLLNPRDECKTLQKVWYIEVLSVLDKDRDYEGNCHDSRDDMSDTLDRIQFRVREYDTAADSDKVVGCNRNEDVPELSAPLDVVPMGLMALWTCEIASLHKVKAAKDGIYDDIYHVLSAQGDGEGVWNM